jgi:hypothetical protein
MDLSLEHEALGVHEQMTLCALYLLASIVTSVFSAHSGTLYRLAIDYAGAGLRISLQADAQAFSEGSVDALPGAYSMRHFLK